MNTLWHKSKALTAGHILRRAALCGLVAGALCAPTAVQAGFEWIPPEDNGPVFPAPQIPAPEAIMPMPTPMAAPVPLPTPQEVMPYTQPVPAADMTAMPVPVAPAPGSSALQVYQQPAPVPLVNVPANRAMAQPVMPAPAVRESYVPPVVATMPAIPVPAPQDMAPVAMDPRHPVIPAYGRHPSVTSIYAAQLNGVEAVPSVFEEPYEIVEGFGSEIPLVLVMSQIVPSDFAYSFDDNVDPGMRVSWNGGQPWDEILNNALAPAGVAAVVTDKTVWIKNHRPGPGHEIENIRTQAHLPYEISVGAGAYPAAVQSASNARQMAAYQPQGAAPSMVAVPVPVTTPERSVSAPMRVAPVNVAPDAPVMSAPEPMAPAATQQQLPMPAPIQTAPVAPSSYPDMPPQPMPVAPMNKASRQDPMGVLSGQGPALAPLVPPQPASAAPVSAAYRPAAAPAAAPAPAVMAPQVPVPVIDNASLPPLKPVAKTPEIFFWSAQPGQSLRSVVENWAAMSGTTVLWDTEDDFILPASIQTHGTFSKALGELLDVFQNNAIKPKGKYYPNNPESGPVLVIQSLSS